MRRLFFVFLLLPAAFFQTGCASTSPDAQMSEQSVDANGEPVSAVPWNKPESWETSGQLGAMSQ